MSEVHTPAEKYEKVKGDIKASLSKSANHSVTTDMWTSSNNVAYMGVTAHWLDGSFGMHNKCLAAKPAPGSHTANLILPELTQVLEEWSVIQQDLYAVTDSGANVKKAMSLISGVLWRPCFAHTLRLCDVREWGTRQQRADRPAENTVESTGNCRTLQAESTSHFAAN